MNVNNTQSSLTKIMTYVVVPAHANNIQNGSHSFTRTVEIAGGQNGAKCITISPILPPTDHQTFSRFALGRGEKLRKVFYAVFSGQLTPDQEQIIAARGSKLSYQEYQSKLIASYKKEFTR